MDDENGERITADLDPSFDLGKEATMGQKIDCMGIPYYMTELNEFVRTFSNYMNDLFTSGADANGEAGLDMFTTPDVEGKDFVLTPRDANGDIELASSLKASDSSY
jgi:hypothetical protein